MTADGSISCADEPDKQETVIGQLLYCEVVAGIVSLAHGGSLVVKMFTMFECHTLGILYLLCCLFEEIEIVKPGRELVNNNGCVRDDPYWISRKNSLELIDLSSANKVSLV